MSYLQKKYRIKNLWKRAKMVFFFARMKKLSDLTKHKQQKVIDYETEVFTEDGKILRRNKWRWYIIRSGNTMPQVWEFILHNLTIYALFATPLVLVFPEMNQSMKGFELFVDFCFTVEIITNFLRLEEGQEEYEFPVNWCNYLNPFSGGTFFFDCLAALPGLITLEEGTYNYSKLARFVHWDRFFKYLTLVFGKFLFKCVSYTKMIMKMTIEQTEVVTSRA